MQRRLWSEKKGLYVPGPEAWLSRAGSQCLRFWERWLSLCAVGLPRMCSLFAIHVSDAWSTRVDDNIGGLLEFNLHASVSYCVVIHSCVAIPHCVVISSCVSSSASRCILTHRKTHVWSENASKNSKQRGHHQFLHTALWQAPHASGKYAE